MAYPAKTARNSALFSDYLGGMNRAEVAAKYGISCASLGRLLFRHRITLPRSERSRRTARNLVQGLGGRPRIWPDCPPELSDDYMLFRRKGLRAAEARALLDPDFRA